MIKKLKEITVLLSSCQNCKLYIRGGNRKTIIPAVRDPAIFKKSVKFGISSAIPVTRKIIKDLAITDLAFCEQQKVPWKNLDCSIISKAHKI
jgi:hypothetical protein